MSMMGELTYFLRLQIKKDDKGIFIYQKRYLKGTSTLGLYYPKCSGFNLKGYSDSDYAGCNMDRKSTSAEAEYVAAAGCYASILWMKSQLSDYDIHYKMGNMTVDNVTFQKNNVIGNFNTTIAYDPNPPTDNSVAHPLKEFLIKFLVMNDKPFTLDFNTFRSSTGLDYNKGKYIDRPSLEAVKNVLGKIATNASYLDKTPVLKNSFPVAWRILFTFVIQSQGPKASGTLPQKRKTPKSKKPPTKTKETPPLSQQRVQSNPTQGLPSMSTNKGMAKTASHPEGLLGDKDSKENKPLADMKLINPTVADPLGTEEVFAAGEDMEEETQDDKEEHQSPSPNKDKHEPSHTLETQVSNSDSSSHNLKKFNNILPLTERQLVNYLRKPLLNDTMKKNVDHREQTDKLVQDAIKDDHALSKKARHLKNQINDDKDLSGFQRKRLRRLDLTLRKLSVKKQERSLRKLKMWTMLSRLKPESITDVKIYPNFKPAVLTMYRNNDKRNFNVHNPFKFGDFGITELDELGLIIEKKKNFIVKDLMTSLGKIYERLKKIPEELRIQSAIPTSIPQQASS
nr:hypothetical protein [Tanacetum cinerariifolium]